MKIFEDMLREDWTRSLLEPMLDSFYAGEPFKLKYSRGKRYKVHLDEHFQSQVDEFEAFLTGKMAVNTIPGYISIARDFFHFLQEQGIKDYGNLNDTTVVEFIVSCHEYRPASIDRISFDAYNEGESSEFERVVEKYR